ncbi:radical SAM protein [Candidatus Bathyarchaeota archaeon]|nr:radical SAM protein [Candidatus Bathyarchaeota archaeon]
MMRDVILIRPPCEAFSLLIGVTEGCSWTQQTGTGCRFCGIYAGVQDFRVRPWSRIKQDLDAGFRAHGPDVRTVFLAGGNALHAPTDLICKVIEYIKKLFPKVERISCYAKNHDILQKSSQELGRIKEVGLNIVYMGLESGSGDVLRFMEKGTTPKGMVRASRKIKDHGIQLSVYVILGLGGNIFPDHAPETAKVLSDMNPDYIRFRSINFIPGSRLHEDWKAGRFEALSPLEIIEEELEIIKQLDSCVTSKILNDHVSNYTRVEGNLPEDKEYIISTLKSLASDPNLRRMKHVNRTSM